MNYNVHRSPEDLSHRMLNAIEPGTAMPIHRHKGSSETCVCVRGHFEEYYYDEAGNLTDAIDMVPGGTVLNIEKGQWHSLKCRICTADYHGLFEIMAFMEEPIVGHRNIYLGEV